MRDAEAWWCPPSGTRVCRSSYSAALPSERRSLVSDLENLAEDVVADRVGETFPVGDAAALRDVLRRVIDDPAQLRDMRERARASYERRYSPTVDVQRLEEVYAELMG